MAISIGMLMRNGERSQVVLPQTKNYRQVMSVERQN